MHLEQLRLENYRGFDDATVEFERDLTVLVGVNGAGKSSVLECLALLLAAENSYALGGVVERDRELAEGDVRRGAARARCELRMSGMEGRREAAYPARRPGGQKVYVTGLVPVDQDRSAWSVWRDSLVFAFLYAVDRTLSGREPLGDAATSPGAPRGPREQIIADVHAALEHALQPRRTRFEPFLAWFREREDLENEERIRRRSFEHKDRQLDCVRRALQGMLPGFSAPSVHRATRTLVVSKDGVELALDQLSDGERCLFAMVGDLARRLALLDPWSDDPLGGEAVALVDEVELHLHPAWQRGVVGALRRVFPNVQFVLTTHSPQVIGEVPTRCIRVLREGRVERAPAPTEGRDSNRILEALMGASSRSAEVASLFFQLATAEDDERWADAWDLVDRLRTQLGDDDPDVSRHAATLPARDAAAAE